MSLTNTSPLAAFETAFFAGAFALVAIVFKQWYDFRCEKARQKAVLEAEMGDIVTHFDRNIKRLEAMISVLRDSHDLWPEKLHIQKLIWPSDSAFFDHGVAKYFAVDTANNVAKFRLRLRNANLDAEAALRAYDTRDANALRLVLEYVRGRSVRLKQIAPFALLDQREIISDDTPIDDGYYLHVKDMIFLPKQIIFAGSRHDNSALCD